MVNRGRAPNATITDLNGSYHIEDWARQHISKMQDCARLLDQTYATDLYSSALAVMQERIDEVDETLSAHVIDDTLKHGGTWSFGSHMAQLHAETYEKHEISAETLQYFEQLAVQSLQQQNNLSKIVRSVLINILNNIDKTRFYMRLSYRLVSGLLVLASIVGMSFALYLEHVKGWSHVRSVFFNVLA